MNDLARAMFSPPAADQISKLLSTCVPLMATLKTPRAGGVESVFDEIQPHGVAGAGRQIWNGVRQVAVTAVLQHALGRRIASLRWC